MSAWETVIGLEIHAQLATRSKIFSGSATAYGAPPNAQANLVDLGYPGVLPVLNAEAVRMAVKLGLAINARIARSSVFARKNYFYPDLPKGYQISQYELPIVADGAVDIVLDDGARKRIGITRAHLEEDAGKSLHEGLPGVTGIDLNRAGTPLVEIVSEPQLRSKEEANDYRYFPDPDLLPLVLSDAFIEEVRATLPELPDQKAARFASGYGLSPYDAGVLTASRELAAYYEEVVRELEGEPKLAANWVMGELAAALNRENLEVGSGRLPAARLAGLLERIADQTISGKIAKEVFEAMWSGGRSADEVIDAQGLRQITDSSAIERVIDEVMGKNPAQLADYRAGKDKLFGFFVGQVMKATGGKANPAQLNELLKKKLGG